MLPACSTDHACPPCTRSGVRVDERKMGKWGSKLSYQEVRKMLVSIEVTGLSGKKIYLGVSIWRQRIAFTIYKIIYFWREKEKAFNKFSKEDHVGQSFSPSA